MKLLPKTIKFYGHDCVVGITSYHTNPERIAIVTNDFKTGEPVAYLTKNIPEWPVSPNHVILDENNHPGLSMILMAEGIVGEQVDFIPSGYCNYPVHKLLV